jgi:hypothetical protein
MGDVIRFPERHDEIDGIDWTREPRTHHERLLRAAIIKHIEQIACGSAANAAFAAMSVHQDLCGLLNTLDGRILGTGAASDLADAIARAKKNWNDANEAAERVERRRLLDRARREVDGVPQMRQLRWLYDEGREKGLRQ